MMAHPMFLSRTAPSGHGVQDVREVSDDTPSHPATMNAGQDWGVNVVEGAAEQRVRQRENNIVMLLYRPPQEVSERRRHPAFGIVVGMVVVTVETACLLMLLLGNRSLFESMATSVVVFPMMLWIGSLLFFRSAM
jgi:hypothetical protein